MLGQCLATALLFLVGAAVQPDSLGLDCTEPSAARTLVGRLRLSEIEGAEDINREAMWEAFGRCPPGPAREACASREQSRFEAKWDEEKRGIELKYEKILNDFEARCRGSVT